MCQADNLAQKWPCSRISSLQKAHSKRLMAWHGVQVTARDDSGQICSHATRQLPTGMLAADGPPTTLSPTGVDRLAFLQANLTRDATYFVNGSPVGARDMFVVRIPSLLDGHRQSIFSQSAGLAVRTARKTTLQLHLGFQKELCGFAGRARAWDWQREAVLQQAHSVHDAFLEGARSAGLLKRAAHHPCAACPRRQRCRRHGLLRLFHTWRSLLGGPSVFPQLLQKPQQLLLVSPIAW